MATWNVDTQHSGIHFSIRHMVIAKVRGKFGRFEGKLEQDESDPTRAAVEVEIDAASIDTGTADRDAHLRSPDFLDAERFPKIGYRSRRIEKIDDTRVRVIGDLTIKGVTHEVPLEVEAGGGGTDPWGNARAGYSARASFDRKDFGLAWNQVLETGGVLVGDRIEVEIDLEVVKVGKKAAA